MVQYAAIQAERSAAAQELESLQAKMATIQATRLLVVEELKLELRRMKSQISTQGAINSELRMGVLRQQQAKINAELAATGAASIGIGTRLLGLLGGPVGIGITVAVARANGFKGNMKDLPLDVAKSIYRKQYWTAPRFDQVNSISSAVAEELLDTGLNCGTGFAKPLLQRALNLLNNQGKAGWPDLTVDGIYGPATLNALKTYLAKRGKEGKKVLVREFSTLCKGNVTLKSVNAILARNSFSMAGSPIGLLYESLLLQMLKDSFNNYIIVHSIFRMHSSYDIYKSACHCLCTVCELKSLGERFFIDVRIS